MTISNNADAFKIHYNMLIASGIWPKSNAGKLYTLKGITTWMLATALCGTMWMETIKSITDFTRLSEILYIMVTITTYVIKQAAFTYNRKTFLKMIDFLKDPLFVSYPDDLDHYMVKTIKYSTFIANLYRYLVGCCVLLYVVYPVLDHKPLPFPFSFELGRFRYAMYVFQLVGEGCAAWNNSCLDTLCTSLMGIGAAQLDILRHKIVRINVDVDPDNKNIEISSENDQLIAKRLKQCVEHHVAIMRFIDLIEQVFTIGLLFQLLTSIIVICNTLFHFILISISSQFFMLANYFVIILVQLFMYCWYGNEIILKSVLIGEACYKCNWHKCGINVRKHLFIIMERSKKPIVVTALKFSRLQLAAVTAILQWSYSCFALLLKMYYKEQRHH